MAERFFASPLAAGCDAEDRELFDSLVWFACDYGSGDPLRWSATRVEILLADWRPREVVADAPFLARAPTWCAASWPSPTPRPASARR